jgi:hypothetical protein
MCGLLVQNNIGHLGQEVSGSHSWSDEVNLNVGHLGQSCITRCNELVEKLGFKSLVHVGIRLGRKFLEKARFGQGAAISDVGTAKTTVVTRLAPFDVLPAGFLLCGADVARVVVGLRGRDHDVLDDRGIMKGIVIACIRVDLVESIDETVSDNVVVGTCWVGHAINDNENTRLFRSSESSVLSHVATETTSGGRLSKKGGIGGSRHDGNGKGREECEKLHVEYSCRLEIDAYFNPF